MKYLVGLIGVLTIFSVYTSILLVRYSYVQAAYMQYIHDYITCVTMNVGEPCARAQESHDKLQIIQNAIGKAPKFYELFVPKNVL